MLQPDLPADAGSTRRARVRLGIIALVLICAAVALWRFTPLADLASPERLLQWLARVEDSPWVIPAMLILYIVGGLVFFPLTVMVAATAIMFEPATAIAVALVGTLASAIVTYGIGAKFLRGTAQEALGPTVAKLKKLLDNKGIIAVAIVRTVPIAPFTAVNMAAGLIGVRLRDYVIGTALGIAPGIAAITLFGKQLEEVLKNPTTSSVLTLGAIVLGWIALSLLLQRVVTRFQRKQTV